MIKLNFGCGSNRIEGWQNFDIDCDIRNPLPFPDNYADYILNEHVIEHVTQKEGYNFFKECRRILKCKGIIRTATPSLTKIAYGETENYRRFLKAHEWGDGSLGSGIRAIIFEHGHQSVYTPEGLTAILYSLGFDAKEVSIGESEFSELRGIEGHAHIIGEETNALETFCVEARKMC